MKKYFIATGLMLLLTACAWAEDAPKADAVKEEMQKLQGTWQCIKLVIPSGESVITPEIKDMKFVFKGDRITRFMGKDDRGSEMNFVLDPSKQPKWIDFDPNNEMGNAAVGIYKLDGDELTLCVREAHQDKSAPRPTEFKSNADQGVVVLKRGKNP